MIPTFVLDDGTTFVPNEMSWEAATLAGEDAASIREWLLVAVRKHWDARTVPTKLGDSTWDEELRAAILGLILAKETGGKSHVIALGSEGLVKYSDKPAYRMEMNDILKASESGKGDSGAKPARPGRRSRPVTSKRHRR